MSSTAIITPTQPHCRVGARNHHAGENGHQNGDQDPHAHPQASHLTLPHGPDQVLPAGRARPRPAAGCANPADLAGPRRAERAIRHDPKQYLGPSASAPAHLALGCRPYSLLDFRIDPRAPVVPGGPGSTARLRATA